MSDSDSSLKRQLDVICDEFENQWSADERPDINSFLEQIALEHRDKLLRMLLKIDVRLRQKAGQQVSADEYEPFGEQTVAHVRNIPKIDPNATLLPSDSPNTGKGPTDFRFASTRSATKTSDQIGPYKLLRQIGEGGMGTVWMAEQREPVKRRVALKLIRADLGSKESIARFEAERQALAMMDHQNIARVFDAGTAESGSPYFVMELVKGIPLNEYCDNNKLSVPARLELMVDVCNAIQHAHQKGIIHRDLKPSNVLVTESDGKAIPKVIDFGLAKALEHTHKLTDKTMFTEFGQVVGTLQYMSPEQAEIDSLDIDTRTDIYSLGVMLYELLTGSTPLDKETLGRNALLQVLEIIREKEPQRPSNRLSSSTNNIDSISDQRKIASSKLQQILRGDLDWIVMKALEKDRTRRYETANNFANDIQRFLNDETVDARPPSIGYRLNKFAKKNRVLVTASALIAAALLFGIGMSTWFAFSLQEQLWDSLINQARAERYAGRRTESLNLIAQASAIKKGSRLRIEAIETVVSPGIELVDSRPRTKGIFSSTGRQTRDRWRTPDGREAWNTDPKIGLVRDASGGLEVWNIDSVDRMAIVVGISQTAKVRVSSNGRLLALIQDDERNLITVLETSNGKEKKTLFADGDAVTTTGSFNFSFDGTLLAAHGTEGSTGVVRIWDIETGLIIATIRGDFDPRWNDQKLSLTTVGPSAVARKIGGFYATNESQEKFESSGSFGFSSSTGQDVTNEAGFVNTWKVTPPTPAYLFSRQISSLRFHPSGNKLAVDGSICDFTKDNNGFRVRESVVETAGQWVTFDDANRTWVVDATTRSLEQRPLTCWQFGSKANQIKMELRQPLIDPPGVDEILIPVVKAIDFDSAGRRMAIASTTYKKVAPSGVTGGDRSLIELWDLPTAKNLATWNADEFPGWGIALSSDGTKVITFEDDKGLVIRDVAQGKNQSFRDREILHGLAPSYGDFNAPIAIGPSGQIVYRASNHINIGRENGRRAGVINIINTDKGKLVNTLTGHEGTILCLAIHPAGQLLASAGEDRMIRLWNVVAGRELARWNAHGDTITAITFSPNGETIASGSADGALKFWHLPTIRAELADLGLNWKDP